MTSDAGEHDGGTLSCGDCGTPATPGARFCRACGRGLHEGTARRPPDSETTGELDRITRTSADVSPPRSGLALRTCPNCGAPNSPHRELCGRCGADLDTGTVPPRAEGRDELVPTGPRRAERTLRRWLGPSLLVLVVLAALLGGLAVADFGPFGDASEPVPEAVFAPEAYPDTPERLAVAEIATLTTLPAQGGISYEAAHMVDDDPATAWNSDGTNAEVEDGTGERIELVLEEPAWVTRLVLRNGDQRDAASYAANARLRQARVRMDGGVVFLINLLDEGLASQAVELTEPVLTTGISIEVLDTFEGDTHPDLAISDLELQGWPARDGDVDVARQRAEVSPATAPPQD